jgi:hypothetical protein
MTLTPPRIDLNGLTRDTVKEALLTQNYLPRQHDHKEELPPIFHSRLFTPAVADSLRTLRCRWREGYDLMPFKRTRHPNIPRVMAIPHPRAYVELVHAISEGWENILPFCESPNSQLEFGLQSDGRMLVHAYNQVADDGVAEDQDPLSDFGMSYLLKTDITSFYPSVYSHALPWALVGHAIAKLPANRNARNWYNNVDRGVRLCQRGETKGLPIGPGTSSIVAEALLSPVDAALRSKYRFTRYIDDYTVFLPDRKACDQFLLDLSRELERYALSLNLRKTTVIELPVPRREAWVTEISLLLGAPPEPEEVNTTQQGLDLRQIRAILDRALELSKDFPDGSVMKYALSALVDRFPKEPGLLAMDSAEERFIEDSLFRFSFFFPTIIPIIQRWLRHYPSSDPRVEDRVEARLLKLLDRSFELGQSDNIVWCLHYLLQLGRSGQREIASRCIASGDPIVVAMGHYYSKKMGMPLRRFRAWARAVAAKRRKGNISDYDLDQFWMPLYQLYIDDLIPEVPYPDDEERRVFRLLKDQNVSFMDFAHDDFGSRGARLGHRLFGDVIISPPEALPTPSDQGIS